MDRTKIRIGTLRLMPKILKFKVITKENVKNLNCRGIKSSMRDPLKMVQKALDKIYTIQSLTLFYRERVLETAWTSITLSNRN